MSDKPDEITDVEFGDDHAVVTFNQDIEGHPRKRSCVFPVELLKRLADEYSDLPPPTVETDYPDLPTVTEADVFDEDEDDEGGDEDEPEDGAAIDHGAANFDGEADPVNPPFTRRIPRIDDEKPETPGRDE